MPLAPIELLTDEEPDHPIVSESSVPDRVQLAVARRKPAKRKGVAPKSSLVVNLAALRSRVQGRCGCLCQCFKPFRAHDVFANLVNTRKVLLQLEKVEQDKYV